MRSELLHVDAVEVRVSRDVRQVDGCLDHVRPPEAEFTEHRRHVRHRLARLWHEPTFGERHAGTTVLQPDLARADDVRPCSYDRGVRANWCAHLAPISMSFEDQGHLKIRVT